MKHKLQIGTTLAIFALASGAPAASIIGSINFSSGPGGGVVLQDSAGNATTDPALATGIKEWQFPEVETSSGSFVSVPDGQSVEFSQPWVFDPSTPMTPLWTIIGFGDFTFNLSTTTIIVRDSNKLLISGEGTITSSDFDDTPATWFFSTQTGATEGKFSWSSVTAVPEAGAPAFLSITLLGVCFLRRRNPT